MVQTISTNSISRSRESPPDLFVLLQQVEQELEDEKGPELVVPEENGYIDPLGPYLKAAAVLHLFDPATIQPVKDSVAGSMSDDRKKSGAPC